MGKLSYENYMNLLLHLDRSDEKVPADIAKRIVSNAISPVISVTSTTELDRHIQETYHLDSLYMFLRFFSDCIGDRDQANETGLSSSESQLDSEPSGSLEVPSGNRKRSNSLFQRDATQSQYVRFTRPLTDLVESSKTTDMLFDYHTLEEFLRSILVLVERYTEKETPHGLLKKSLYHRFFSLAVSSTTYLSPYETFNHPVVSIIALDIPIGQGYEDARGLLTRFKNMNHNTKNFPVFLSTNDILPVFLLCYNGDSEEQLEICQQLGKKLKKQLFVESVMLPLWRSDYSADSQINLHQPVMSSLEEVLNFLREPCNAVLSLKLINSTYDVLEQLVNDLMVPFMQRKISFWEETILQPRRSLFHGAKFFKKLVSRTTSGTNIHQQSSLAKDENGNEYFVFSSPEFLMRKLADWSMMLSDYKTAYSTYESLNHDVEHFPKYSASCLEWCAVSVLMGAQNIVTAKMLKNDIDPLIQRALESYKNCALYDSKFKTDKENDSMTPVRSYETRCMFLASELFLSLSDTWTSTPYALRNLEMILTDCKLGPCSQIMIWERLSDCYYLRADPRIRHRVNQTIVKNKVDQTDEREAEDETKEDIVTEGLTRMRKAAFFLLVAADKWAEQKQWRQAYWCLKDVQEAYKGIEFINREDLILAKLDKKLNNIQSSAEEPKDETYVKEEIITD
ncbi:hypothetical protein HG537_0H02000 [Torulaspora globosa]|uniref:Trafficking protein particle complex III-specific subunit 85 n=1 Tax=Torulaspora globosa TaxID=48254 RepID=A0A7H9HXI5_9SACH|nr:hypothetical protein HG537_0H02000 [Torulaspora sp. CBS 2947]